MSFEEFYHSNFFIGLYCQKIPSNDSFTTHSGLIFRERNGSVCLFHLAWHKKLRLENAIPKNKSVYIGLKGYDAETDSNRINTDTFLNLLKTFYKKNFDKLPYMLVYQNLARFLSDGSIVDIGNSGFTCSTFLMSIFKNYSCELVDHTTWKARETEDQEWKNAVLKMMEETGVEKEHIASVSNEVLMFRFKPEEVVSSGLQYPKISDYDYCVPRGAVIKSSLAI